MNIVLYTTGVSEYYNKTYTAQSNYTAAQSYYTNTPNPGMGGSWEAMSWDHHDEEIAFIVFFEPRKVQMENYP